MLVGIVCINVVTETYREKGEIKVHSIKLGVELNAHSTPIWIAIYEDLPAKYGLNISRLFKFRSGVELASAIARGEVDAGYSCLGPILNLIDIGVDVKIVLKTHNYGYAIVVKPDRIKSVDQLNGSVVYSIGGVVAPTTLLLLKLQDLRGLVFDIRPIGDPQVALSMLIAGQINAVSLPEHYASLAESLGMKILLRAQDIWPNMPGSYLVVRGDALRERREAVRMLVEITRTALRLASANKSLAAMSSSRELEIDTDTALRSVEAIEWTSDIHINEIQEYIDFMFRHRILEKRLDANEIVVTNIE